MAIVTPPTAAVACGPLVTVVIPAFKSRYFEAALLSALGQTWRPLEIVICDDSREGRIEQWVQQHAGGEIAIDYRRNSQRLGEAGNLARCIEHSRGVYIKVLHDDDVLHPGCVAALVDVMLREPGVALAAVRRRRIDPQGCLLADIPQTVSAFAEDVVLDGPQLVSLLAEHPLNFIGEPSCIMARRSDLVTLGRELMSLAGETIHWVGDLALYSSLLQRGAFAWLDEPRCDFRVSPEQFSQAGRDQPGIGKQGHADFSRCLRALGWRRPQDDPQALQVRSLADATVGTADVLARLNAAFNRSITSAAVARWLARRVPDARQRSLIDEYLLEHAGGPTLNVVILDDPGNAAGLALTLGSLEHARQYYPALAWTVIAQGPAQARVDALNAVVAQQGCDWLMLAACGDEFTAAGLMIAGLELVTAPACRALYGDALVRLPSGELQHAMRPDFNLDYLLSCPQEMASHWLFQRDTLLQAGGFDAGYHGALEWEMILRLIDRHGPAGLGHVAEPWVIVTPTAPQANAHQEQALLRHLERRGYVQAVLEQPAPGTYAIDYRHAQPASVSVLVVPGEQQAAFERCVISLLEHCRTVQWQLLVAVSPQTTPAVLGWLQAAAGLMADKLRIVQVPAAASYTRACNLLAAEAQGEYLLLLRADAAVLEPGWMAALLNHAQRPEVGVVGGLGLTAQGQVSHGATLLGLQGGTGTAQQDWPVASGGYRRRLQVEQNYSAVGGAGLMVRAELFRELGGFDPQAFDDAGGETDLCLRAGALGYLCVWTPRARLLRQVPPMPLPAQARQALDARWPGLRAHDPAYNANLSLNSPGGFQLADSNLTWRPLVWRPLPVVLAQPADLKGCGHYRVIQPLQGLRREGLAEGVMASAVPLLDIQRYAPDSIILQRQVMPEQLAALAELKAYSRAFKVFELDDYLPNLPVKSLHRAHMPRDILRSIRRALGCVDRFIVSTAPLAEAFSGLHGDIRVVENRLDPLWWGQLPRPDLLPGTRPRVGWAGGVGHSGDLELIVDVVKALAEEVDWVFLGLCPPALRPHIKEYHPGVALIDYPAALASLDLDLALAPLEQNRFNDCKSNLRLLEYGICGYPVVCSDVLCFQGDLPVTRVKNRFRDWVEAIRAHLADPLASARAGAALQAAVRRDWMLDRAQLQVWQAAWLPD